MLLLFALLSVTLGLVCSNPTIADFDIMTTNCVTDDGGKDDQPGQKDLNEFCSQPTTTGLLKYSFTFDDIDFHSQTGYGCILLSVGSSAFPHAAVCVSVTGSITQTNTEVFTCAASGFTNRCTVNTRIASPNTCCSIAKLAVDPFHTAPNNLDTAVICTIDKNEVDGAYTLLNACSYASGSGSSPGDCIHTTAQCTADNQCIQPVAECMANKCVGGFCVQAAANDGGSCTDDGAICTDDVCSGGSCTHPPNNDKCACTCPCLCTTPCITAISRTCLASASTVSLPDQCVYKLGSFNFSSYDDLCAAGCTCPTCPSGRKRQLR